MEKFPEFNKELEDAVLTVMNYFNRSDDGGAFFIKLLISADSQNGNAAVEELYRITAQEFAHNRKSAEEVITAFQVIRKWAIIDSEMKEKLEQQIQLMIEMSITKQIFDKNSKNK
jgi:hypothetical protein